MDQPIYLGVDVAGASNTWMAALAATDAGALEVVALGQLLPLKTIVAYCETHNVVAVAIDAQLTLALEEETGFRPSDLHLRELLPKDCRNWVASVNSLMAVPVRGMLLADYLAPSVGTILETHPRSSLFFALQHDAAANGAIRQYKRGAQASDYIATLWQGWSTQFDITSSKAPHTDGALDAIVCATIAYLFHHEPQHLLRLRRTLRDKRGHGPFYVLMPPETVP